ncbi:MAG: hypothetical protein LC679_15895, partial [Intrasporangiaceae bacterium]|nr:hypothetical protein [Intrasporangiaceae bacterium]
MTFRYPKGPDDPDSDDFTRGQFKRAHDAWASGDPASVFGESQTTPTPWPRAARDKRRKPYDQGRVHHALSEPEFRDVDPTQLHSTQPSITRQGVDYYMGDEYEQTGTTFADQGDAGNRFPMVYGRDDGQNMILSG